MGKSSVNKSAVGGRQKEIATIQSSTRAAVRQGVLV
jgi:hypothetical protein